MECFPATLSKTESDQRRTVDLESFAEMNADPRVMEYFLSVKSFDESPEEYNRIIDGFEK